MAEQEEKIPEYYADSFRFTVAPYGVAFTFGTNIPHPSPGRVAPGNDSLILRMSLEQPKVLSMMLRRNLRNYEQENSLELALPPNLYTQLGIARNDWTI